MLPGLNTGVSVQEHRFGTNVTHPRRQGFDFFDAMINNCSLTKIKL